MEQWPSWCREQPLLCGAILCLVVWAICQRPSYAVAALAAVCSMHIISMCASSPERVPSATTTSARAGTAVVDDLPCDNPRYVPSASSDPQPAGLPGPPESPPPHGPAPPARVSDPTPALAPPPRPRDELAAQHDNFLRHISRGRALPGMRSEQARERLNSVQHVNDAFYNQKASMSTSYELVEDDSPE